MSIKIKRNEAGNCIIFEGSSDPVYWNACLSGEVDSVNPLLVNIINDIATKQEGEKVYVKWNLPYQTFLDEEGNPFSNAFDAADYITQKGNVSTDNQVSGAYQYKTGFYLDVEEDVFEFIGRDYNGFTINMKHQGNYNIILPELQGLLEGYSVSISKCK